MMRVKNGKRSVGYNVYDNWYGYYRGVKVEQFFGSFMEQETAALKWLSMATMEAKTDDKRFLPWRVSK